MALFGAAAGLDHRILAAQEPTLTTPTARNAEEILSPPAANIIRRDLAPLAAELPDTTPREGLLPPDAAESIFDRQTAGSPQFRGGDWQKQTVCWKASELRHRPVYFEDTMLERHGQTRRPAVQTALSGARFFGTFPVLPYAMTVEPAGVATSTLGHFRPGSPVPLLRQRPPLQASAGLIEAGTVVGLIFLVP